MTASVAMLEQMKQMEAELKRLRSELEKMKRKNEGFERIDTDVFLTEVYNR
ncbi:hypothetical protein LOK74_03495 [Brevibacillus humidisoli]|uniref:hypothetical protein n=1 Tax=Brevibacillus humidisoli TaxID=2895522 RepID=UPI001E6552C8|nr:hypothetical protein [Brevibacillus humidisoli]UFJ41609.1 hypothetical protein LOK74_03495 [Brevibacillus humidisoli]